MFNPSRPPATQARPSVYTLVDWLGRRMDDHGLSILCYHAVDASGSRVSVRRERFAAHMQTLSDLGCVSLTASEVAAHLREGRSFPRRAVALMFDDGFASVLTDAAPVLQRHGFTATVFIISGMVGRRIHWRDRLGWLPSLPLLSWSDLRELGALGFELGAHTISHPFLTRLPTLQLRNELETARLMLEDTLGQSIPTLAYPFGDHDERVCHAARVAGYAAAFTTAPRRVTHHDPLFALPRMVVPRATAGPDLAAFVTPAITLFFQAVTAARHLSPGRRPWYVPDPRTTDSSRSLPTDAPITHEHTLC